MSPQILNQQGKRDLVKRAFQHALDHQDNGMAAPATGNIIRANDCILARHPCFSKHAARRFGRIHLPVALGCNIQCNFCKREYDCVNESRPGVTSRILDPTEAIVRLENVLTRFDNIHTVGIAGPGEPLASNATFETFRRIRARQRDLHLCVSTNGLLLPEKIEALSALKVNTLTVTVNAVDSLIGAQIYAWIHHQGVLYRGNEAARLLIDQQLHGIAAAVSKGILVKVNSVMIPSINDQHMIAIAKRVSTLGVYVQNIIPLIPQYRLHHIKPPTRAQHLAVRAAAARHIRQMEHCRRCRADAVHLLHKDLSQKLFPNKVPV